MMETTGEGSGWVWIRKQSRFSDGVFHELRLRKIYILIPHLYRVFRKLILQSLR
jgi:hypothetical protein